jgi:hypothetical protein
MFTILLETRILTKEDSMAAKNLRKSPGPSNVRVSQASDIRLSKEAKSRLIATAAYFRAEKRGFAPGGELQDWLEAERDVERQLAGR